MAADLAAALVAALGELHDPTKAGRADVETRTGGTYTYAYLTLPQLLAVVRPVFAAHGLAVTQTVERTDLGVAVATIVLHESGQERVCPPLELRSGPGAQDVGSAITYARRYTLAALAGLAGDQDEDDRSAAQRAQPAQPAADRAQPPTDRYTATAAKRAVMYVLEGDRALAADLWKAADPGRGPFTQEQVDGLKSLARQLVAGTAHLEAADDGTVRLVSQEPPS